MIDINQTKKDIQKNDLEIRIDQLLAVQIRVKNTYETDMKLINAQLELLLKEQEEQENTKNKTN